MKRQGSIDIFDIFDIKSKKEDRSTKNQPIDKIEKENNKDNKDKTSSKVNKDSSDVFDIFDIKSKDKSPSREKNVIHIKKKETKKPIEKSDSSDSDESGHYCVSPNSYNYPHQSFKYKRPTDPKNGPYGTTWVHDSKKKSDDLTDEDKVRSKKVSKLLKIEYPPQRSKGWFEMRKGCISASDCGCVIGVNHHEPQYGFYVKKLTEPPFQSNKFCYHGTKLEEIATMVYEYRMDVKVKEFGLVKHPKYSFIGASPDGIVGKYKLDGESKTKLVGTMLEIKCVATREINEKDPFDTIPYYEAQVQNQLESCDLDVCHFWQCKIREYINRQEFIEDTDPQEPFRSKSFGFEKGCLIQLLPRDKIGELRDNYDEVVYGSSKFIYPPRIDMTPLECDLWIVDKLNNIEQSMSNEILKNYQEELEIIQNSIKSGNFIIYYKEDIQDRVNGVVEWYVGKFKKNVSDGKKSDWFSKYAKERIDNYHQNYIEKLSENKFIRYLIMSEIEGHDDLKEDPELIEKMMDPDKDPSFYEKVKNTPELLFVRRISQMLRDLEYPKKYCFHRVFYWRIEKTHCHPVKRDKKWFATQLPIYKNVWNNITIMRANPELIDLMIKYINDLPTIEKHYEHEFKDNDKVMKFVDYICKKPEDEKGLKKYQQKVDGMMNEL